MRFGDCAVAGRRFAFIGNDEAIHPIHIGRIASSRSTSRTTGDNAAMHLVPGRNNRTLFSAFFAVHCPNLSRPHRRVT